jgi:hypothetical protein
MIENGESSSAKVIWDRRWARLAVALSENGVEPRMQSFCRGWVQGFLRFARPKKYFQLQAEDVEEYLHKLVAEGKQNWQVRQAAESLRVFYQQVELVKWATPWPERLTSVAEACGTRKEWLDSSKAGSMDRLRHAGHRANVPVTRTWENYRSGCWGFIMRWKNGCGRNIILIERSRRIWIG